jgi:hypothetical protein
MHADLASDDHAGIGLADQPQRVALAGVFAKAITDCRGAAAKSEKPPGAGDLLAISERIVDLLQSCTAVMTPSAIRLP